jgi:hypothetical protein
MNREQHTEDEINWEIRFHLLADAVDLMNETSIYNYAAGCCIPTSEAWDYLTDCAKHYAQPSKVKKLPLPALPSEP